MLFLEDAFSANCLCTMPSVDQSGGSQNTPQGVLGPTIIDGSAILLLELTCDGHVLPLSSKPLSEHYFAKCRSSQCLAAAIATMMLPSIAALLQRGKL